MEHHAAIDEATLRFLEQYDAPVSPPLNIPLALALQAGGGVTAAGQNVNEQSAMSLVDFYAGVRVLAEAIGPLPFPIYKRGSGFGKTKDRTHPLWRILNESPDGTISSHQWIEASVGHLNTGGNAYSEIEWTNGGDVKAAHLLPPKKIRPERTATGVIYHYTDSNEPILARNMLHFSGLGYDGLIGYNPVRMAAKAIGYGLCLESFGNAFFANGARFGGILTHPNKLSKEAKSNLQEVRAAQYAGPDNAGKMLVLEEAMTFEALTIPPEDAQFLGSRQWSKTEMATLLKIPPHMIGDLSRSTNNNIEQQALEFVKYSLTPWCVRLESEINRKLFRLDERELYFAELLLDALLRGDLKSRYESYAIGRQWGWMNGDDIHELENMNPMPDGEGSVYLAPVNMTTLARLINPPEPQPQNPPVGTIEKAPPDDTQAVVNTNALHASRDCVENDLGRMIRKETETIIRLSKRPDSFLDSIDDFYTKHRETLAQAIAPSVRAYLALTNPEADVAQHVAAIAERLVETSRRELLELSGTVAPAQLEAAVETVVSNWRMSRAKEILPILQGA